VTSPDTVTPERVAALLARIRARHPLIHHITNPVTAGDVANVTLALGAAPVMAQAPEEVEEVAAHAAALVLNTGTLTVPVADAMVVAGRRANELGIPVIVDPVGAGATTFRSTRVHRLLTAVRCACVRGNAGEIAALSGREGAVRGVDAAAMVGDVTGPATRLARQTGATVAATGVEDVLTDGTAVVRITNGDPLLARITGSGCMATAVVAAAAAVEPDPLSATTMALLCFEVAAELAAARSFGPGTFRAQLIDAIARLDAATVARRARVAWA
jgi:hydroxyethylthiazole kinase